MLSEKLQKEYDEWCRINFGDMPKLPATFTVGQDLKKGDKAEITQGGYIVPVLSEARKKKVIEGCLLYCIHRLVNHPEAGVGLKHFTNKKEIERILGDLTK